MKFLVRLTFPTLGLLLVSALLPSRGQAGELLRNASFEDPAVLYAVTPGAPTDWTANSDKVFMIPNFAFGPGGGTPYGTQFVGLDSGGAISQTITGLVLGEDYSLTIAAFDSDVISASELEITVSGGATATYSAILPVTLTTEFVTYELDFSLTSDAPVSITFSDPSSMSNGIDNAVLSVVPEPGFWALWCSGACLLGGSLVRRRRFARARHEPERGLL